MSRSPRRSLRDRQRDVRKTRTEGARRVLRARQLTDATRDREPLEGRPPAPASRPFPSRHRVTALAARVRRLGRRP
jgi:hypothetical protein